MPTPTARVLPGSDTPSIGPSAQGSLLHLYQHPPCCSLSSSSLEVSPASHYQMDPLPHGKHTPRPCWPLSHSFPGTDLEGSICWQLEAAPKAFEWADKTMESPQHLTPGRAAGWGQPYSQDASLIQGWKMLLSFSLSR